VDLPFRITNCRFLLAIVFRTWGLVWINFFICVKRIRACALHCVRTVTSFFALHTASFASNFCTGQNRKPLHWFLHQGKPTMLCQCRACFTVNQRRTSCSSNYSQYLVVDTIWDRVFHKLLGISENSTLP